MNNKIIFCLFALCAAMGILFYAITHHVIIFQWPQKIKVSSPALQTMPKTVSIWYYTENKWQQETTTIVWTNNTAKNSLQLIEQWLMAAYQENIIHKKIAVQTVLTDQSNVTLFISLDRTLFAPHASTMNNMLLIEGLLKTLRTNGITVQKVQLLVHHELIDDTYIDCSVGWPLQGFYSE
jgi:hypothetical protein